MTKPVFGVFDKARLKPVSSATETSQRIEISSIIILNIIPYHKRITKELIRLRGCAGWSAPLLFANHRRQVFSQAQLTLWPYHYGNLGLVTHSGVIVKLPSNKG